MKRKNFHYRPLRGIVALCIFPAILGVISYSTNAHAAPVSRPTTECGKLAAAITTCAAKATWNFAVCLANSDEVSAAQRYCISRILIPILESHVGDYPTESELSYQIAQCSAAYREESELEPPIDLSWPNIKGCIGELLACDDLEMEYARKCVHPKISELAHPTETDENRAFPFGGSAAE